MWRSGYGELVLGARPQEEGAPRPGGGERNRDVIRMRQIPLLGGAPVGAAKPAIMSTAIAASTMRMRATKDVMHRGEGRGLPIIHWLTAVLNNGLAIAFAV